MNENNEVQNLKVKAYNICRDFLQGYWKTVSIENFKFQALRGGLSNGLGLFRCSLLDSTLEKTTNDINKFPKEVLVRFYDPSLHDEDTVIQEIVMFTMLSEKNLGPKLYGVFENGRIEEYLPSRSVNWNDFSDVYIPVAKEMAKIHALEMPIKKTAAFERWTYQWLEDFLELSKLNPTFHVPEIISSGEFAKEMSWLTKEIEKLQPQVVFCHNDLQGGNILLLNNSHQGVEKKITLIDFEYAAYNYRSFDIANYFIEKCFDYKAISPPYSYDSNFENFPTKTEQEEFVNAYLNQLQQIDMEIEGNLEELKNKILKEVKILRLGPLLLWLMWAFKAALDPTSDFPFWEHGQSRWELYKILKEEIIIERNIQGKTDMI